MNKSFTIEKQINLFNTNRGIYKLPRPKLIIVMMTSIELFQSILCSEHVLLCKAEYINLFKYVLKRVSFGSKDCTKAVHRVPVHNAIFLHKGMFKYSEAFHFMASYAHVCLDFKDQT